MARLARYGLILGLWFACAGPTYAFGGLLFGSRSSYSSYYYPGYPAGYYSTYYYPAVSYSYHVPTYNYHMPVYAAPQAVLIGAAVPCPQPKPAAPPVSTYAQPMPAPAGQTPEPPLSSPAKPKVKESSSFYSLAESKSYYNAGAATGQNGQQGTSTCKVGFWNLTTSSVSIQVSGQVHVIPASRSVTLILPRQFAWGLEGQSQQKESIPADRVSFEIVLR